MLYNEMIPVDTHDTTGTETNFCGPFSEESGLYDQPAGPGGGGSTPPTYGPFLNPPPASSGGGAPSAPSGSGGGQGGGGGWQQWVNPQTIGATVGIIGSVAGAVGQNKSPDKARIKAVCGRKPLFNIKGKKDKYNECVSNLMAPQPIYTPPAPAGMSTSTKVIIGSLVFLVLLAIIITVIVLMKRKAAPAPAAA